MNNTNDALSFYGKDPGATKFGNFINYYSFHSANERTKNLDQSMFPLLGQENSSLLILDVGCNTGELTIEIYKYMKCLHPNTNVHILAIDIDPLLIERANKDNENITFISCNIMTKDAQDVIKNFLDRYKKNSFDITFCFSITMWIHINNGDSKFIEFLNYVKNISNCVIVEPQPWKCYRNAQRRMKRAGSKFELFNTLSITNDVEHVIENVLSKDTHEKVYESTPSSWNRKIQSYHRVIKNVQ